MAQREIISIPTGEGGGATAAGTSASLRLTMIRPNERDNNRRPLIVINRGVASGEADLDLLEAIATALADAGLIAALLEPRTTSLILDDFHAFTLSDEVSDVLAIVRHAASLADADAARLGLLGWSFGALAAVEAVDQSSLIGRLCLLNPATASFVGTRMTKAQATTNGSNWEPLPRAFIESVTGREAAGATASRVSTLIVHAAADRFIPPDVSLEWLATLEQAKRPVERLLVVRADHGFGEVAARSACVERLVTHFAAAPAPKAARIAIGARP